MSGTDSPSAGTPTGPRRPWLRRWGRDLLLVAVTVVVVLLVQALVGGEEADDSDDEVATEGTERTTTTASDSDRTTATADTDQPTDNFEDGTWQVGAQIRPGRYISRPQVPRACDWARLADVAADEVIVAQDGLSNQVIVEVLPSDDGFRSDGCGVWELYEPRTGAPSTTIEDGDWVVGEQVEPGVYQSTSASFCQWERASGFTHTAQEVVDSLPAEPRPDTLMTVELAPGERFTTSGCATWVRRG